jgi:SAM-dependent methyltransferase
MNEQAPRQVSHAATGLYVQYGCGRSCPDSWLNFDVSPRLRLESLPVAGQVFGMTGQKLFPKNVRYGDIVKGLPVGPMTASGVYCSHVLEHLDRESVSKALRNTYAILRPGGIFRLVVPDLTWRARKFLQMQADSDTSAADRFMRTTYLGTESRPRGPVGLLRAAIGNSAHLWMYDEALMRSLLADAGFADIRRCKFGDAEDPAFAMVEEEGRFYDDGNEELAIEARRPLSK